MSGNLVTRQMKIVDQGAVNQGQVLEDVALFNANGTPYTGGSTIGVLDEYTVEYGVVGSTLRFAQVDTDDFETDSGEWSDGAGSLLLPSGLYQIGVTDSAISGLGANDLITKPLNVSFQFDLGYEFFLSSVINETLYVASSRVVYIPAETGCTINWSRWDNAALSLSFTAKITKLL